MTITTGSAKLITLLAAIALSNGVSTEDEICVSTAMNGIDFGSSQAVFNVVAQSRAVGVESFEAKLCESEWKSVDLVGYKLREKVSLFASAKDKLDGSQLIDGRFSAQEFFHLNYYDTKSDCSVAKSEERHEFCTRIMSGSNGRTHDRLVRNLHKYCSQLVQQVDRCCVRSIQAKVHSMGQLGLINEAATKFDRIRANAVAEDKKWLPDEQVLRRLREQEGEMFVVNARKTCKEFFNEVGLMWALSEDELGFDREIHICTILG